MADLDERNAAERPGTCECDPSPAGYFDGAVCLRLVNHSYRLSGGRVVFCGSGASMPSPERAICAQCRMLWGGDRVITSEDLDRLMRAVEGEAETFLTGRGIGTGFTQSEDMTILGPFGGPPPNVSGSELTAGQNAFSKQLFESGQSTFDVVNRIVADDLVVLVLIERNNVRLRGATEFQPWVLRTTQVFRLDDDGHWWRLHRHADPLIRYRPGDETFALARETSG